MTDGTVITVFSTKGGAGTSVIACNLALVLSGRAGGPVALVDGDLEFGDVAAMLRIAPQSTIVDLISSLHESRVVDGLLVRHSSGLLIVPAPADPASFDQILPYEVMDTLEALAGRCQYVIVDTAAQFSEHNLAILDRSDHVVLVASLDVPCVKNVKLGIQMLGMLGVPMSKVHLVLNRADSNVRLEVREVERMLRTRATCLVPSDVVVPRSVNRGRPVVTDAPRSAVAGAIETLADRFMT